MPCSVVSSFKLWPEEKTGPAARSTTQRVESSAAAFKDKYELSPPLSDGHQILNPVMSVCSYCTSCNSLLSAVITSSESEFRVRGELRLICLAARPAEYEEVTCGRREGT